MPFGAELCDDGVTRFRLWAPAARRVELLLESAAAERALEMEPIGGGYFERISEAAGAGCRYRFRADGGQPVPDPASRFQPLDVHGPSEVIDPTAFAWPDGQWAGRTWEETVIYELHVGCFSAAGGFADVAERLDSLAELGVTALELMPVADFPGQRNWGYDGVLPFAPDGSYGRPEDLKALVAAAHARGLMVFLDVVYNHFGPEGNYLHLYAPQFFTDRHQTPWGAGLNFDSDDSRAVRDFFIHNALYWLTEYRFDGLRLDAVHAIADDSASHILVEIAEAVRAGPGRQRQVHLVLENDLNEARYLQRMLGGAPRWYVAQWNDDFHHAAHVLATGERDGYYTDYGQCPAAQLGRCLTEGYAFQGEASPFRGGRPRGEATTGLPLSAFVNLLQNHDQVGNRAFGERIGELASPEALRLLTAILLLGPSPPLLFMGQEFMASAPFLFFCDFGDDLADAVTEGRRREFAGFSRFTDPHAQQPIPDPNAPETFLRSKLDWEALRGPEHQQWLAFHRRLLELRHREILPHLTFGQAQGAEAVVLGEQGRGLLVRWRFRDGASLTLVANLDDQELPIDDLSVTGQTPLFSVPDGTHEALAATRLPPWSGSWHLARGGARP